MRRVSVVILLGCGLVLAACSSGGAQSASTSTVPSVGTNLPAAPPTFSQVKAALASTGIALCGDLASAGNLNEYIYPQAAGGDCADNPPHSGLVYIFTENTPSAAQQDLQTMGRSPGDGAWIDGSIAVYDENPAPGTGSALEALGFKAA
jgi:hypothetical protein